MFMLKMLKRILEFKPPQRVVGMYKYLVNCTLEPSASQFDPLKEVFPCADVEYGLDNFYNLESIGIEEEGSSYELEKVQTSVTPSLFRMDTIIFICLGIRISSSKFLLI